MAVEPGPNFGTGTGGSSSGGGDTQFDYRDDEVGPYPFDNGNGGTIGADYTKTDAIEAGDKRRRAYMIALLVVGVLTVIR